MYENDKRMLDEIEKDFEWGKKVGGRGYDNLDDEQLEWMIQIIKHYDEEVNHLNEMVNQLHKGNLNLLNIKRELEKEIESLCEVRHSELSDLERETFGLGDDF
jgi:predicted nuclease with TOPRIM domain